MRLTTGIVSLVLIMLSGCSDSPGTTDEEKGRAKIHAEDIISVIPNSFGCISEESFNKTVGYLVAKEKTKASSMFTELECFYLPTTEKFKVLHVGYGVIEIVNVKSDMSHGMWTYVESADRP